MNYPLCGKCLHAVSSHTDNLNGLLYCASCMKYCDADEYNIKHKPTDIKTVMEMSAKKQ